MPSTLLNRPRLAAVPDSSERPPSVAARLARRPSVFLLVILAAQLMVVLDATIVNVALPHIESGLGFTSSSLSWVLNAYVLTFGGFLLLGARAGDLLGRRRVFLAGIALFSSASLLGGLAVTAWMLLAARALQGVGAALAAPSALSLLTTTYADGPQRVRAIGLYTTVSAAGGAVGLVAGGLLTEWLSWRWVMFVNVPIGVAVFLLGRIVIAETERRHGRFDGIGAISSTLGMTGIVFGLVEASSKGWTNPLVLASFAAGAALLALFVQNETRAEEPILPMRLLTNSSRTAANSARGLMYAGMYGMIFFVSQFLQDVQGYSPLRAGVAFLPAPATVFLASQLTSRVLVRRLRQKTVMLLGLGLSAASLLLATRIQAGTQYWQILVSLVLLGAGLGIAFVSLTTASLNNVQPQDAGAASGLINVSQQLGGALGLAVLVSVFGAATAHANLQSSAAFSAHATGVLVGGIDDVFWVAALFTLAAVAMVAWRIRLEPRPAAATEPAIEAHEEPTIEAYEPAIELHDEVIDEAEDAGDEDDWLDERPSARAS